MKDSITIVGMDVHKNSISIALAETGDAREVRSYGAIGGTMAAPWPGTRLGHGA